MIFVICLSSLLLAGVIKGALGMGLPLFAVPVLVTVFDLPTAIALMMIPILASNLIQAWEGKNKQISISSFKRFFPTYYHTNSIYDFYSPIYIKN